MLAYYRQFFRNVHFPSDGESFLLDCGERAIERYAKEIGEEINRFYADDFQVNAMEKTMWQLGEELKIPNYTMSLIFLICASQRMREDYRRCGYPDALFWDTISDLRIKAAECCAVKGVWGIFVAFWYPIFYRLSLFKLGRLEYERIKFSDDIPEQIGGLTIKKGDTIYSVHIPGGEPLTAEACLKSFRLAYDFFAGERGEKPLLCHCFSWLLYPDNSRILPPGSNILEFMRFWKIDRSVDDPDFGDLWRVFGMDFGGDVSLLPRNTSLQRAMADWISAGGRLGEGIGFMLFDGEKVITQ